MNLFGESEQIKFSRAWSMPSADTLTIKPIRALALRYHSKPSLDPFARNCNICCDTNDFNPDTAAKYHMESTEFLSVVKGPYKFVLLDPPYSPRQVSEHYKIAGRTVGTKETQIAGLYRECKELIAPLVEKGGFVMTCGWNSCGMGKKNGFRLVEILLVCCGAGHNDYICTVEEKL